MFSLVERSSYPMIMPGLRSARINPSGSLFPASRLNHQTGAIYLRYRQFSRIGTGETRLADALASSPFLFSNDSLRKALFIIPALFRIYDGAHRSLQIRCSPAARRCIPVSIVHVDQGRQRFKSIRYQSVQACPGPDQLFDMKLYRVLKIYLNL